jgi:hypothetical protein
VALTDEDLAYMRETQGEHRPTQASLIRRTEASDGMGGTTTTDAEPQPVAIRVAPAEDVPEVLAERYGAGVVTITMDLTTVTHGDKITVTPTEAYEVVSDGAIGAWTTAQQVLAVRTAWPAQGA